MEEWTNLSRKEELMNELKRTTSFKPNEVEKIYNDFLKISGKRRENKSEGFVDLREFLEIMK
jgi:hypothetical protein